METETNNNVEYVLKRNKQYVRSITRIEDPISVSIRVKMTSNKQNASTYSKKEAIKLGKELCCDVYCLNVDGTEYIYEFDNESKYEWNEEQLAKIKEQQDIELMNRLVEKHVGKDFMVISEGRHKELYEKAKKYDDLLQNLKVLVKN